VVLCDTSGRLHTNLRLMEELAKCRQSLEKCLPGAPHETLLVLDGTTGPSFPRCHGLACFLGLAVAWVMTITELHISSSVRLALQA
jgi:hypothetical protein